MNIPALFAAWSIEPAIVITLVVAAALYGLGLRSSRRAGLARGIAWWRVVCFGVALIAIFFALDGPLDAAARTWLTASAVQHELLVMVAAPLLLFGAPLWPMWHAVPLAARQAALGWAIRSRWPRRLADAVSRVLFGPVQALVIFIAGFTVWHLPVLDNAALANHTLHAAEQATFFVVALLFWAQVIPSWPIQPRLGYMGRTIFVAIAGLYSSVVGSAFMFSTAPFYAYYAALARPAGAASALVDQHLAGAAMDIPGVCIFFVAICALMWLWMREDERQPDVLPSTRPGLARREVS